MASACFRNVGHIRPALWPRGCNCKHDWPQVDVLGCQIYRLLALLCRCSRSDTSTSSNGTPHPTSYTQGWQTLPAVVLSVPTVVSRLFNFPAPRCRPLEGKCTQKGGRPSRCHRMDVREKQCFFSKACLSYLRRALFFCVSSIRLGAPKVNNQF